MKNLLHLFRNIQLALLLLAPCFKASARQKADLIIYNGKRAAMAKPDGFKQAIKVKIGLIVAPRDIYKTFCTPTKTVTPN